MNPIQITFRDIPYSKTIEETIYDHYNKLYKFFEHIIHCHVVLSMTQKHKHQGKLYNIHINLAVPSKEIVVTHQENEDIYIATRNAFDALSRQLENYAHIRRGEVKTHDLPLHGFIVRLFPEENFGFIRGKDENEYYFSATNIASTTFTRLAIGDNVRFLAEPSNDGLHARHITVEKTE